jgi:hypothetical protein
MNSDETKHIFFGFQHFSRSGAGFFGVENVNQNEKSCDCLLFVCVCVASVVCLPRAKPFLYTAIKSPCMSRYIVCPVEAVKCMFKAPNPS